MIIGILASAGHDPVEIVERWSWAQIGLVARSIIASKVWALQTVIGPFLPLVKDATGIDVKLPSTSGGRRSKATAIDLNDPAAVERARRRDEQLINGLASFT